MSNLFGSHSHCVVEILSMYCTGFFQRKYMCLLLIIRCS